MFSRQELVRVIGQMIEENKLVYRRSCLLHALLPDVTINKLGLLVLTLFAGHPREPEEAFSFLAELPAEGSQVDSLL